MAIDASLLTQEEYYALKKQGAEFLKGMSQQTASAYVAAVAHAKAASRVRGEQGMAEAVQMMAEQGVHAYAYTRRDGTVVRVPADVGIRRAMREQMRQASSRQAMELARDTGHDLVYIDETPACRDSHKPINGKAFSVTGATPGYERLTPELEALMRDYGCQHRARLYWPGVTKTPEPQWRAKGYTDEEMRGLQTEQRALENAVRKAKRSSEAVKAALAEAEGRREVEKAAALSRQLTIANAKVRARQARVAEHVAAHSDVLTRQPWREALYDSARRMERSGKKTRRYADELGYELPRTTRFEGYEWAPEEIAGVKRGEPMDFERADGKRPNPNFTLDDGYRYNCQSCVVAYELRRRGYDLEALSRSGNKAADKLAVDTGLAWIDPETGKTPKFIVPDGYPDMSGGNYMRPVEEIRPGAKLVNTPKRYLEFMESIVEEGKRYTLEFSWKKSKGGHIVCLERRDGELLIYDPQSGKEVVGAEAVLGYLGDVRYYRTISRKKYIDMPLVRRTDDKLVRLETANGVTKGRER